MGVDIELAKKMTACLPFADADSGIDETMTLMKEMIREIEAFRAAGLAKPDGTPIVRGVLGTLPVTADGYAAMPGATVFVMLDDGITTCPFVPRNPSKEDLSIFYGSREAAEAASSGESRCLHDSCSQCDGTGVRKDGLGTCIHALSCPCPKCTPRC